MWLDINVHGREEAKNYNVYLNDKLITGGTKPNCFAANEEEGWADIYVRDAEGKIVIIQNEIQTKRLYGKVELKRNA
jgi:RecB family endonuclease NucS